MAEVVELTSTGTFQISGRGTVKVVHPPDRVVIRVGDTVRIDGALWSVQGVELTSPRRPGDPTGLVVRPVGGLTDG